MAVQVYEISRDEFKRLLNQRTLRHMNNVKGNHDYVLVQGRISYTMMFRHEFKISLDGDCGYCDWYVGANRDFDTLEDAQNFAARCRCDGEHLTKLGDDHFAIAWEIWHLVDVPVWLDAEDVFSPEFLDEDKKLAAYWAKRSGSEQFNHDMQETQDDTSEWESYPAVPFDPERIIVVPCNALGWASGLGVDDFALVRRYEYFRPGQDYLRIEYDVFARSQNPAYVLRKVESMRNRLVSFHLCCPWYDDEEYCIVTDELWTIEDFESELFIGLHWLRFHDIENVYKYRDMGLKVWNDGFAINPFAWNFDSYQAWRVRLRNSWRFRYGINFDKYYLLTLKRFRFAYYNEVSFDDLRLIYDALSKIGMVYAYDYEDMELTTYVDANNRKYHDYVDEYYQTYEDPDMREALDELRLAGCDA